MEVNDSFSQSSLCSNCKKISCCTNYATPLIFQQDYERLKKIGKSGKNFIGYDNVLEHKTRVILQKKDNSCMFFDQEKKQCQIYNERPFECKMFPFDIFKINGEYRWIVYSCNPDSNWEWAESLLTDLEADKQFPEIIENLEILSDLERIKSNPGTKYDYTILRKVRLEE